MNILIYPSSGILEFNSLSAGSSALDSTLSGVRFSFNTGEMKVYGNNSANLNRFSINGIEGNLFQVTDTMSGSLFSVNDFVGLPLIEVYNDTIKIGAFNDNTLVVSGQKVGLNIDKPTQLLDVNGNAKAWQIKWSGQSGDPRSYDFGDVWYNSRDRVLRTKLNAQNNSLALGKTFATFKAIDSYGGNPSATTGIRNNIRMLEFDQTTAENATFVGVIPSGICLTSGITAKLFWMSTATTNSVMWAVAFEKMDTDLDVDSFAASTSGTSATNATAGILTTTTLNCTAIDSLVEGNPFRLKVTRFAADVLDNMAADAQLVLVELQATL
jgi:hypothetical protein